jgi:UDP-N-acetylmuramyl tripeptide synthase
MACGKAMKLDPQTVSESLGRFQCGFGRMEKFDIHGTPVRMILIKNPAGCNQVLNFLTNTQTPAVFVACLNDRAQDGKDVSWIWDVDFERLLDMGDNLKDIYVSGVRADDMALRFRYAGIPMEKIHVEKDYEKLMEAVTSQPDPVYVMPTYTAMLNLRDKISRLYGFKEYWEA